MTTQATRLVRVETKMEDISKKLDEHVLTQREDFQKVFKKLDDLHGSFAGKWVEKVIVGIIITFMGGLRVVLSTLL